MVSLMLLVVLLVLSGGVFGQEPGNVITMTGSSGPLCGRNTHCLKTATCSDNGSLCECPTGLVGNAKLGCVPPTDPACYLQSDPHLKTLYGEYVPIATPCLYKILYYNLPITSTPPNEFTVCLVDVYADNTLWHTGQYFVQRVEVRIRLNLDNSQESLSVRIDGSASDGGYRFEEWRKLGTDGDWVMPTHSLDGIRNVAVRTSYDQIDNMAEIKVERCGLYLKFRPADDGMDRQSQVPGVVFSLDGNLVPQMDFFTQVTDLASTPTGPSLHEQASLNNADIKLWTLKLALENTHVESVEQMCYSATANFRSWCNTEAKKMEALRICGGIFYNEKLLKCLAGKEVSTEEQAKIFRDCTTGICRSKKDACFAAKEDIQLGIGCEIPDALNNFDCESLD